MYKLLMSINKEPAEEILSGKKKYEYRKVKAKKEISKIIIYETSPVKLVAGEVEVLGIIFDDVDKVYELTKKYSGISKESYYKYFDNCSKAVAYKLGKVTKYNKSLQLKDLGINYVPQSYIYLKN